jgi:macrolide-specific efflux system membrane fusion protein
MAAFLIAVTLATFAQVTGEPPDRPAAPAAEQPGAFVPSQAPTGPPTFRPAHITAEQDVLISAEVEGALISLPVKEGSRVATGQVLATIDDRVAQAALVMADMGHKAALARAEDDIEKVFAEASAKFAEVDLRKDLMANRGTPGAVTDIQIEQKKLAYRRSTLQIEKAVKDLEIAAREADVKKAELDAAKIQLDQRTIRSTFDGEVQQLSQKQAQWVKPGDPIMRLVRFDKLRVECFVPAASYDPAELANRRVTVTAALARGRAASAEGRVVYVDQTLIGGQYRLRAEVDNVREGDYWLLRPGLLAEMTVHTGEPPIAAEKTALQPNP